MATKFPALSDLPKDTRIRFLPDPDGFRPIYVRIFWCDRLTERRRFSYVSYGFNTLAFADAQLRAEDAFKEFCRKNCTKPFYIGHRHVRFDSFDDATLFYLKFKR